MADVVDKRTRSHRMAGIRGKDSKPELKLRKALHARGFTFVLHDRRLPGRPDIVLPRCNAVIQAHGCFWHRHDGCRFASTPSTRVDFWAGKFSANVELDRSNIEKLHGLGWRTAIVWECMLRGKDIDELTEKLSCWIKSDELEFQAS